MKSVTQTLLLILQFACQKLCYCQFPLTFLTKKVFSLSFSAPLFGLTIGKLSPYEIYHLTPLCIPSRQKTRVHVYQHTLHVCEVSFPNHKERIHSKMPRRNQVKIIIFIHGHFQERTPRPLLCQPLGWVRRESFTLVGKNSKGHENKAQRSELWGVTLSRWVWSLPANHISSAHWWPESVWSGVSVFNFKMMRN